MTHEKLKTAFLQGGEREAASLFNHLIRSSVREAFWQMMAEEVDLLCGPSYQPDKASEYRRAGSESGRVYLGGDKEAIRRPRVPVAGRKLEGTFNTDLEFGARSQVACGRTQTLGVSSRPV